MLSNTADYALRAILALARAGVGRAVPADELAAVTGAPRNYLGKTLNTLAKAGLLRSARGPAGGFALAVAPETIAVAHIVDLFEEPRRAPACLLGPDACDAEQPCAAHHTWAAVRDAVRAPLATTTVADLLVPLGSPMSPAPTLSTFP